MMYDALVVLCIFGIFSIPRIIAKNKVTIGIFKGGAALAIILYSMATFSQI